MDGQTMKPSLVAIIVAIIVFLVVIGIICYLIWGPKPPPKPPVIVVTKDIPAPVNEQITPLVEGQSAAMIDNGPVSPVYPTVENTEIVDEMTKDFAPTPEQSPSDSSETFSSAIQTSE